MRQSRSRGVVENPGHPVIDGGGHWLEPVPIFLDLAGERGPSLVDRYRAAKAADWEEWYDLRPAERSALRSPRRLRWGFHTGPRTEHCNHAPSSL